MYYLIIEVISGNIKFLLQVKENRYLSPAEESRYTES